MPIKQSFIARCILSKWAAVIFIIPAAFLLFTWGHRSFAARGTAMQTGAGGSPISARAQARRPSTRENFDARANHQRTLAAPPATGSGRQAARPAAQTYRLKQSRPSVRMRWSSLTATPSRLFSHTETLSDPSTASAGSVARGFLKSNDDLFRLSAAEVDGLKEARRYRSEHNGVTHLTLQQEIGGVAVFQAAMTMHLNREGAIIAASGELLPGAAISANLSQPKITAIDALSKAAEESGAEIREQPGLLLSPTGADSRRVFARGQSFGRDVNTRLVYFPLSAEQARLAWEFIIWMRETPDVYLILIDAERNSMLFRQNLTNYEQNPLNPHGLVYTKESPRPDVPHTSDSPPVVERGDLLFNATPFNGAATFELSDPHYDWWSGVPATRLISNNTDVHLDRDGTPNQPDLPLLEVLDGNFSFPVNLGSEPSAGANSQAAQVNLFYWINRYHDILYSFGFTEAAGNFQTGNFGLGGAGGDAVLGDAQDGLGINNANFSTPPDGQPGRVQMFLWNTASPQLDGSFDQGVIIHELTHGLSNRLVGNGVGLGNFQSASMGEGWSDYFGLTLMRSEQDDPRGAYVIGGYVINNYNLGVRRHPYSTDMQVNPLTFRNLSDAFTVHDGGEIWCGMLWEMRALLLERYGFVAGQRQSIQLVVDGLKLTPTEPTFIDARDAILLADRMNNGGANQCLIWQAFAKRGMGFFADTLSPSDNAVVESFEVSPACSTTAALQLDKSSYVDNETVRITLGDGNAKAPVFVDVASSRTGDWERIRLEPDASTPGLFSGSIRLDDGRLRRGDGELQGSDLVRDKIRVVYLDRDSGSVTAAAEWTRELTLLDDDVERGNQNWLIDGPWAITDDLSGSPSHSWRINIMALAPSLPSHALTSPLLDLTGLDEVTLSFSQSRQFTRFMFGRIEISVDDGVTWTAVESFGGNQTGFVASRVLLPRLDGWARLRFQLVGLLDLNPIFWAIDDIRLTARSANPRIIPPGDAPEPIITAISPAFGPPSGGTQVIISGSNFTETSDTSVTFSDAPAAQVAVLGSSTITAVAPAHSAGAVSVRVTNRRGTARSSRGFTYYEPGGNEMRPILGGVSPASGSVLGGTAVTLSGLNFTPETAVLFGSQAAPVTYINGNTLRVIAPTAVTTGAPAVVDVIVRNGSLQTTRAGGYSYVEPTPPAVQVLNPAGGERIYMGSLISIRWQSSDNRELVRHSVRFSYLPSIGLPTEQTIDVAPQLEGEARSFTWIIPTNLPIGAQARISVTATDDEGAVTEAVSGQFVIARRWETNTTLSESPPFGSTYVADERYLYAIGQRQRLGAPAENIILRYDPETHVWTGDGLSLPPSILFGAKAVYLNGKIYIPGGVNRGTTPSTLSPLHLAYDIAANTWSTQAEAPDATTLYAVAADIARGVYYHTGGVTPTNFSAAVRRYDPSTNAWTDLPPMNTARAGHNAAVIEGKLYVAAGNDPSGSTITGEVYDFETGQWSPIAPLNHSRTDAQSVVVQDAEGNPFWLLFGGGLVKDAEVYDVRNDRWIALDNSFDLVDPNTPRVLFVNGSGVIGGYFHVVSSLPDEVSRLSIAPLETSFVDRPPILSAPAAQVGTANTEIRFKVTASDLGSGAPLSITAEGMPERARFTTNVITNNRTEGTFRWKPRAADIGSSFNIAFTASDGRSIDTKVVTVRAVECSELTLANAAGSGDGRLAADSIASAFGANLAFASMTAEAEQLPLELAGTTVTVNGIKAQVASVSPDRVDFLVPPSVEAGNATVVIRNSAGSYSIGTAQIVDVAPAILGGDDPAPRTGTGLRLPKFEKLGENRLDILTLFVTGIRGARAANPNDENGIAEAVEVTIDGYQARVLYAGAYGKLNGLDKIIVKVPAGLTKLGRRRADVVVSVDGVTARGTAISLK